MALVNFLRYYVYTMVRLLAAMGFSFKWGERKLTSSICHQERLPLKNQSHNVILYICQRQGKMTCCLRCPSGCVLSEEKEFRYYQGVHEIKQKQN